MASILDFNTTPSNNTAIDGNDVAEDCEPAGINNAIRSFASIMAKFFHAITAEKTTAGTADVQTLSTGLGWTSLEAAVIAFKVGAGLTNTGAMTLNVDSLGAKAVKTPGGADPAAGAITAGRRYFAWYDASATTWVVQGLDSVLAGISQTLTVGYPVTPYSAGTKSSGTFTPSIAQGNFQYATNGGAHTLAAPTSDGAATILYTNNGSAGTISFSGFSVGSGTGDTLTTTDTSKFLISIIRINSVATYHIKALQ